MARRHPRRLRRLPALAAFTALAALAREAHEVRAVRLGRGEGGVPARRAADRRLVRAQRDCVGVAVGSEVPASANSPTPIQVLRRFFIAISLKSDLVPNDGVPAKSRK